MTDTSNTPRKQLTPAWLSTALSTSAKPVVVSAAKIEAIGHGMMSTVYRATLTYDDNTSASSNPGPKSVIVKLPTENEVNREVAFTFDTYQREVNFYRNASHLTPMRIPSVYFAECTSKTKFVLVMEDLRSWTPGDQIAGCSLQEAEAVTDALADLHASFWGKVDDGSLDWMPNSYPSVMSDGLFQGAEASYDNFSRVFSDLLSPEIRDAKQVFLERLPKLQAWINEEPRTVIHGDFRLDNLFFDSRDGEFQVACCDWQASVRGKGIHDLAYFLASNLVTSMRREHEQALIRRWVEGLASRGVVGYGYDQAFDDYRKAILVLWAYVVNNGALANESERDGDWISAQVERHGMAMVDHECLPRFLR
jgi:hypothetical protein